MLLPLTASYKILIEYSDFNNHDESKFFDGMTELIFTGEELYESVITCGMPAFYICSKNVMIDRKVEILYKIYLLNTALEANDAGYLVFSNKMNYLDSTERGFLNYYVGMFITKLISKKIFNFKYLVHLSIVKRYMSSMFVSRSQPDLIAFNDSDNCYSIFEAKGRSRLDNRILESAKEQVQAISWVRGSRPSNAIVSAVHPFDGVVKCHLKDPKTKEKNCFDISKIRLIWLYYEPIYLLFKKSNARNKVYGNETKEMHHDIQIGEKTILTITMSLELYKFFSKYNFENEILEEKNDTYNDNYQDEIMLEEFQKIIKESKQLLKINEKIL